MRVALMGGSFNPPHVGHLMAATYVHATQGVDEVWLLPSFRHPFGKEFVAFEHRLAMCEALGVGTSGWLKVSAVERDLNGPGYTVDILGRLKALHPEHEFTLILGSDLLAELPKWKDAARLEQLARVVVLYRAGFPDGRAVGPPIVPISSSEVRERLAQGLGASALLPDNVLQYVRAHRLYGT